ncbi:MAG: DUF2061 domain-containing protein [Candidatus Lokiarchaeota archaeon]|nr:DUF2061 domain-containing protein [Candidatus Lokiarchaeota archaeon]
MTDVSWKRSLYKTVIYRMITLILGTLTALFLTGDIGGSLILSLSTEAIQSVNYYFYELIWNHYEVKRLKKQIKAELLAREVDVRIDLNSIREISYELSQIDTFVQDLYVTVMNFYNRMLKNEELMPIHETILANKRHFEKVHAGRNFPKIEDMSEELEEEILEEAKEEFGTLGNQEEETEEEEEAETGSEMTETQGEEATVKATKKEN